MNLKQARLDKGLTQFQVAVAMGVTLSTILRWESGKTEPKASQFEKLKAIFAQAAKRPERKESA